MSFIRSQGPATIVCNGLRPIEGPKAVAFVATIIASEPARLEVDMKAYNLTAIQTVYVDNSANAQPVTVELRPSGQVISTQPHTQGFYPVLLPVQALGMTVSYAGTASIMIRFVNVEITPFEYSAQPPVLTVSGTVSTIPAANTPVTQAGPWAVDQSGLWNVGQVGTWTVDQGGVWNVGQLGVWNVGQLGTWTVRTEGAQTSATGIVAPAQVTTGAGRLWAATFFGGAAGNLYDNVGVAANIVLPLPAAGGTVTFPGGWPIAAGIYVVPGAGQTVNVSY